MGKIEEKVMLLMDAKLDEMADYCFSESQKNVARITDTGELLGSGRIEKHPYSKKISYSAPHAPYVEFGTHPHLPPVDVIIAWAGRRGLGTGKELNRIGWAIAKKIEREGTEPQPFLRPALNATLLKYRK